MTPSSRTLIGVIFSLVLGSIFSLVETRKCSLLPWQRDHENKKVIGWTKEIRDDESQTLEVQVGWGDKESLFVSLPYLQSSSLASTLWPPSLAGAILCRSPAIENGGHLQDVIELGAGLGLAGSVLSNIDKQRKVVYTDHDGDVMEALAQHLLATNKDPMSQQAISLEWRDDDMKGLAPESFDMVLGTDVAYYSFLLRPLLDTAVSLIKPENSLLYIVGQANRVSQWELLHLIKEGGYSQKTDKVEPPLPGNTDMLLYRLEMEGWQASPDKDATVDGSIPIAVISHATSGFAQRQWTDFDYSATPDDERSIDKSF